MKYILLITSVLSLWSCGDKMDYPNHIGDLEADESLDAKGFKPCTEEQIYQYYNFGENIQYIGEKRAIINTFKNEFKPSKASHINGYITIRFVVNCMGQSGRFRVKTLDTNYKPIELDAALTNQILTITKGLEGWKPAKRENLYFDYYQYLTFKITQGRIESILP